MESGVKRGAAANGASRPSGACGAGTLYVVSTPIGNLADLSGRAITTMKEVGAVLAEDTRHSRPMLERYGVATPLVAYHEHNEAVATPKMVERLLAGESLALISDAGTPLLSDPGARLVRAALEASVKVTPVPGPSAMLAALVVSGLAADRFTFFGFLPRRGRERSDVLAEITGLMHTAVLYEAPARVAKTLADLVAAGTGDREAVVARELTKQFEECRRGTVRSLHASYEVKGPRGEVVLVIAGGVQREPDEMALRARARALREAGLSARDVARVLNEEGNAPRNLAYRLAHE
ncbi:MAG TPA: 16S rRNA (cytidine(1402)-2'-O)-methyltransferase [Gemmatimonadaceae bacterium]|nr:16S rRNA (cytidine(1402)-2'-O)-methyltransferase [Gemmatimonadaceae bacterium]